ncbi:MAG: CapA family protein [Clostridia bacterium]|nr:CapA family protein [Clostridia bacterium]
MKKTKYKLNKLKIIRFILILLILIATILFIAKYASNNNTNVAQNENEPLVTPTPDITITMAVTGDIMCHNTMYKDAYDSSNSTYDFSHFFTDIKPYLQNADITIGNLETTFAGSKKGYSGYPTFNTPESLAKNLKDAGFDVVSTANNHSLDKGFSGLTSTINYLDEAGLSHTGTYATEEDSQKILIENVNGVSIAFLSFTYGTNGIPVPSGKDFCINLIDEEKILYQLNLAKAQSPDIICVSMHWGVEYQTKPNATQKELTDLLFKNGADIILGNHPHVLQSMEKRTIELADGSTKEGFVIYSLGNFMANQNYKYTQDSAILNLSITKNGQTNKITIDSATYTPIYIYKDKSKSKQKFRLLDIETTIKSYDEGIDTSIGKTTYNTLVNELKNIKTIIGEEIK